jgi:hypothetical protein
VQYRNLLRYGSFMLGASKRVPAMRKQVDELGTLAEAVRFANSARAAWQQIDAALPTWWDVFTHHLAGSSPAGAMAPILLRVTAKNEPPTAEDIARVAELLSGATNVESADIAAGVDRVVDALAKPRPRERALHRRRARGRAGVAAQPGRGPRPRAVRGLPRAARPPHGARAGAAASATGPTTRCRWCAP